MQDRDRLAKRRTPQILSLPPRSAQRFSEQMRFRMPTLMRRGDHDCETISPLMSSMSYTQRTHPKSRSRCTRGKKFKIVQLLCCVSCYVCSHRRQQRCPFKPAMRTTLFATGLDEARRSATCRDHQTKAPGSSPVPGGGSFSGGVTGVDRWCV
jgi:hypothetical protein